MNKVLISGRLTREPETRFSQGVEPIAITHFSIAVNRKFKRDGEPEADFINCVSFGKTAEFIGKYFNKGKMIGIVGSIRNKSWTDNNGQKRISTEIYVEEAEFLESRCSSNTNQLTINEPTNIQEDNTYYTAETNIDEEVLLF